MWCFVKLLSCYVVLWHCVGTLHCYNVLIHYVLLLCCGDQLSRLVVALVCKTAMLRGTAASWHWILTLCSDGVLKLCVVYLLRVFTICFLCFPISGWYRPKVFWTLHCIVLLSIVVFCDTFCTKSIKSKKW